MELWIKVLALEDSRGRRAVILTSDTLGIAQSIYTNVCAAVKTRFGLEPEQLMLSASLRWADDGKPGAMDELTADAARELGKQMATSAVVLGPIERSKAIGFAEASEPALSRTR